MKSRSGKLLRDFFFGAMIASLALCQSEAAAGDRPKQRKQPRPAPTPYVMPGVIALGPSDPVHEEFLGLRLGMSMGEVREHLRRLGAIDVAEETIAEGKMTSGNPKLPDRAYDKGGIRKRGWKLPESSPFEWVTVTSNRRGIITLMTAAYRAGHTRPFGEIASLKKAAAKSATGVTWNVLRPTGNFLIIANGAEGKATTVSMKLAQVNPIFVPAIEATREHRRP